MNKFLDRSGAAIAMTLAALAGCTGEPPAAQVSTKPDVSLQEIMLGQIDPSVDELWAAVGTVETIAGVETRIPATEAQWNELGAHAGRLVEIGNLLQIPGRHTVPVGGIVPGEHIAGVLDHAEVEAAISREWPLFVRYAQDFQAAATAALVATRHRDADSLLTAGERLQEACEQCHGHFWYPGDKPPPDPQTSAVTALD